MTEAKIQELLIKRAKARRWEAVKIEGVEVKGLPYVMIVGAGNVGFVEVKRNGGRLDAMQQEWISRLSPHAPTFVLIAASTPTLRSAQIDHILHQFAGWLPR